MIDAKGIIGRGDFVPKRNLGQCFLTDKGIAERIVNAIEITPGDHVIEVGPGVCALTCLLCDRAGAVTAVEIDRRLIGIIDAAMSGYDNLKLLNADILKIQAGSLLSDNGAPPPGRVFMVSNMPYYISTPIMTRLFEEFSFIDRAVLMMQSEVAGKLLAAPSSDNYCMLTAFAKSFGTLKKLFTVPPHFFSPQPGVESTVMLLGAQSPPFFENAADKAWYFRVVRAVFARRRKTIANSLMFAGLAQNRSQAEEAASLAGVPCGARGESLGAGELLALSRAVSSLTEIS